MAAAIVAEHAIHVRNAEECLSYVGCFLVDIVLLRIAEDPGADQPVQLALNELFSPWAVISSVAIWL
jgi:hypothetical protein